MESKSVIQNDGCVVGTAKHGARVDVGHRAQCLPFGRHAARLHPCTEMDGVLARGIGRRVFREQLEHELETVCDTLEVQ